MREKILLTCGPVWLYTYNVVQELTKVHEMQSPDPNSLIEPEKLAARWKLKPITLAQWRWTGRGPRFLKLGRHAFYRFKDIEAYEEEKAKQSTTQLDEEKINRILLKSKHRRGG